MTTMISACKGKHLAHTFAAMLLSMLVAQPALAQQDQDRHRADIEATKLLHLSALTGGIVTLPPLDKPFELTEYGSNIGLKFTPASINAPPRVVVRPNVVDGATGELCSFRYVSAEHDLYPVFDYEDIYGFTIELPDDWGRLDDGDTFMSNASPPDIFHYNTGAFVTVRRSFYSAVPDPEPWYPEQERYELAGEQILFTNTNDIQDVIDGDFVFDDFEQFPLGINALSWEAENKIDVLFDIAFQPLIFMAEAKYSAKAASKANKAKRFARNWGDPVKAWKRSIDKALFNRLLTKSAEILAGVGLEVGANELAKATDSQLLNYPTGTISRDRQDIWVLDEVPPTIELTSQPEPFEANTVGGELATRHFDELRELLSVRDNCNRPVILGSEPRGARFWPVNQTTTMQWCVRDMGPKSATGGRNESCVDIDVTVEDTRPPILFTPPPVNLISGDAANTIDIGWAGVFDVADPDVIVENDAPDSFPVGRTPVTWNATDSAGNTSTGTQWINVKSDNLAPTAVPQTGVAAVSFEETRIDLQAFETEDALDGRYDQLSFRIEDVPDNGFFVAPLFPFFIDDHRTHRINPDGTYTSYGTESRAACEDGGVQPDPSVIYKPEYVTVDDDGVMYVMDSYLTCRAATTNNPFLDQDWRIARFVPDAEGELQYANQWHLSQQSPGDNDSHLFIDSNGRIWTIPNPGTQIVVLGPALNELQRIDFNQLTMVDPLDGDIVAAFNDANRRPLSLAVSADDILYVTTGGEIFAYDLTKRQPDNANAFLRLPPVVQWPDFSEVDETAVEPWASYHRFLSQNYVDMAIDSMGDLYVSDRLENRIWKFRGVTLNDDRSVSEPSTFVGWLGKCDTNLDSSVFACDTTQQVSVGFSCEDDLCDNAGTNNGAGRGQFNAIRGLAMSPQDVLYATDTDNFRVQRFSTDGYFAGEAVSECQGSCFVLGDFGYVNDVAVNSNNFYVLDQDNELTHVFETTPVTDIDDQTMSQSQTAFVNYKSNDNYVGPDSFSFIAWDGLEYSNEATVDIDVTRNFRAPIATPGLTFSGAEDSDISLMLTGLDPDEDTLDFEVDTQPANGTVTREGGQFTYTPDPDFFGTDSFTFVATDAPSSVPALTSAPETVSVVVTPVNDPPVILAEPLDDQPLTFASRIEARLTDVDLDDRHRIAIDWGDGSISDSDSDDITLGRDAGIVRIIAEHAFSQVTDASSPSFVTICASDQPSASTLTCASPDVTTVLQLPVNVGRMVDLRVDIDDSQPKQPDPDIPEIEISEPLVDGGDTVTYTVEVQNFVPTTSDYRPTASAVTATIEVPEEMTLVSFNSSVGNCSASGRLIDCTFGDIPPDGSAVVSITAAGSGMLLADADATLQVEAIAVEQNVGDDNAGSWQTKLLLNGELDPDGDGVANSEDAFPGDPAEWLDTDADGIGNNADHDDDNDALPDTWEDRYGLDRLDATDRSGDLDSDGLTNETEFAMRTRPDIADSDRDGIDDAGDSCPRIVNVRQFDENGDALGDRCDPRSFAAVADIGDADGDTLSDVVLVESVSGVTTAYAKSAATDFDIVLFEMLSGDLLAEGLVPLTLGSGETALALIYTRADGSIDVRMQNAWTGAEIRDYPAFPSSFTFVGADATASGSLVVLVRGDDGSIRVTRRDPADGANSGDEIFFAGIPGDVEPLGIAAVGDDAVVVLADRDGVLSAQALDMTDGRVLGEWELPPGDWLSALITGTEDGFMTLVTEVGDTSTATRWALSNPAPTGTFEVLANGGIALAIESAGGIAGVPLIRVAVTATSGSVEVVSYDATTGLMTGSIGFLPDSFAPRGLLGGGAGWIGMLASDASGNVIAELRDATTGGEISTLTAESMSPPPPPPPPPPSPPGGDGSGGGSGGGSIGWLLLLGLLGVAARRSSHGSSVTNPRSSRASGFQRRLPGRGSMPLLRDTVLDSRCGRSQSFFLHPHIIRARRRIRRMQAFEQ